MAVKSIAPLKASGEDGFPAIVYQKYWLITGEKVTKYCLDVLHGRRNMEEINKTCIILIPKVNSPKAMSQFRPISLCKVIYKIISKVLINRFRRVLSCCIEDNQRAFIAGRQITDNIFVAYEILHSFKKRRGSSKKGFALKIDMSKAYDRIELGFLENMMRRLGFCEDWILLVMRCITSVAYSVVLNGRIGEEFCPQRGLRQGDPLSPYLFLICVKGFSRIIALAKREGRLFRTKIGMGNVSVSHLFFADDSILFGDNPIEGASNIKNVVNKYEKVSGQLVNFDKSLIYFNNNVDPETRIHVGGILGVRISNNLKKYLGLPTMVGRRKKHAFVHTKERFIKVLNNWSL
ncbi:reverse transcriptase [Gossypium australe]|uniref:Reverse transcriptase n=1 Tax=Gossypium australe TaxID=47621 RepID=A0A5B6UV05_9ROSI|nr:reverse transcriptase [Gossypium australe]